MLAMSRGIASVVLAAAFALPWMLGVSSCEREGSSQAPAADQDETDQLTQRLLASLRSGDRDAVLALSTPALASELEARGEGEIAVITQTLEWAGGVESLQRGAEQAIAGGVRRQYSVAFGRGDVGLSVTVVGAKVEGFEFDAGQWQALVDRAAEAAAGTLRVAEFRYVGPKGETLAGPVDPADIYYELALEGLEAQFRAHHVVIAKTVRDAAGNEVYRQTDDDEVRFSQAEPGSSGGRVTGTVAVPGPGQYQLVLEIQDLVGAQTMTHRESFVIE